jgi:TRAP transporter 4TM/12TM fusion protein
MSKQAASKPATVSRRELSGKEMLIVRILGAVLAIAALADALDIYRTLAMELFKEQKLATYLGLSLAVAFLLKPFKGKVKTHVPWYDWLLATISLACCIFVAVEYERIFEQIYEEPLDALIVGGVILLLLIDALRRATGPVLAIFLTVFLVIGAASHLFPGQMQGRQVPWTEYTLYLAMDSNALLGIPLTVVSTIVITFIFFGKLLDSSHGSKFFTDISMSLMGRYRGGAAKISVMASSLFGSISGSAVANVVSSGVVSIPLMRRGGFPAHVAGGIEAVASTGGQLMPPMMGAAAFVMAEFLQIEFKIVVLAALIPAILYYLAVFVKADLYAAKHNIKGLDKKDIFPAVPVLRGGWYFTMPFVLIIVGLFVWNLQPHAAAMIAAGSLLPIGLLLGYKRERMRLKAIYQAFEQTGLRVTVLLLISCMAGVVIGVLNISGLGFALTQVLVSFTGTNILLLLAVAAIVSIILGMGMPTLGVYLLLAMLVTPAMVTLGVMDIGAHMFALYFGMLSMITPPVCVAAFTAATLADSPPMKTGYAAVGFGWSAYLVPFLFVLSPELLMKGEPMQIVISTLTASVGIVFVTAAMVGYMIYHLSLVQRCLHGIVGVALLIPNGAAAWALPVDGVAMLGATLLIILGILAKRNRSKLKFQDHSPSKRVTDADHLAV